jgi:GAF domain-containing protein
MTEPLLASIVSEARVAFDAAACSIAVLDDGGEALEFAVADGAGAAQIVGTRLPLTRGIAGYAVVSGQALAISDVAADPRFARETAEQSGYVPTTILAAPVVHEGESIGVIEVLDPALGADLALLGRFADQAAAALRPAPA